jgi:hypothetical protein
VLLNCPVLGAVVASFNAGSFQIFDEAAIRADFGVTILAADKGRCREDRVATSAPVELRRARLGRQPAVVRLTPAQALRMER